MKEILAELDAAQTAYDALVPTGSRAQVYDAGQTVKRIKAQLSDAISEGAAACPTCGGKPHGMAQPYRFRGQVKHGFEIGCTNCLDHRAAGPTRDQCVADWNAGAWSDPGKAQATNGDHAAARALCAS